MGPVIARLLLAIVMLAGTAAAAGAEDALAEMDSGAIRRTIEGQMEAFRRDDGAAAFAFAAPAIQKMFGTPGNFMAMVRAGYRPVYRPSEVVFDAPRLIEGTPLQPVRLVGPDGVPVLAIYSMERQPDGSWRIGGCQLVALEELAL